MKKCNKPMPKAKNGKSRGRCRHPFNHHWKCGNRTCPDCGVLLNKGNTTSSTLSGINKSGTCLRCANARRQRMYGRKAINIQKPRRKHTFPCGCSGYLTAFGGANKFSVNHGTSNFGCRVSFMLLGSRKAARLYGYVPIDPKTPHHVIRNLMEEPNCERCGEPLRWEFGYGKTPHLHHDHETDEVYGFTHPWCNPRALQREIDKLKKENRKLLAQVAR
jgi:hypothetical protein